MGNGNGAYIKEEDELRGMGLGMAVPQPGQGHDHLTGGMGFGDQFWSGSFPNPTPGSDRTFYIMNTGRN